MADYNLDCSWPSFVKPGHHLHPMSLQGCGILYTVAIHQSSAERNPCRTHHTSRSHVRLNGAGRCSLVMVADMLSSLPPCSGELLPYHGPLQEGAAKSSMASTVRGVMTTTSFRAVTFQPEARRVSGEAGQLKERWLVLSFRKTVEPTEVLDTFICIRAWGGFYQVLTTAVVCEGTDSIFLRTAAHAAKSDAEDAVEVLRRVAIGAVGTACTVALGDYALRQDDERYAFFGNILAPAPYKDYGWEKSQTRKIGFNIFWSKSLDKLVNANVVYKSQS
eukprot:477270-Amphidinium_carterae.4